MRRARGVRPRPRPGERVRVPRAGAAPARSWCVARRRGRPVAAARGGAASTPRSIRTVSSTAGGSSSSSAAALRVALDAVEGDAGAAGSPASRRPRGARGRGAPRRAPPRARPCRAYTAYALVLSSRVRAADGRPMLDPGGPAAPTFVAAFETGAPEGPPPAPVLTEVRADAGDARGRRRSRGGREPRRRAARARGRRLAKRTATGALASCADRCAPGLGLVAPGGVALVAGGAWDGRYALPPASRCSPAARRRSSAGSRTTARPRSCSPTRRHRRSSTLGGEGAPVCPAALERLDPARGRRAGNLACTAEPGSAPGLTSWWSVDDAPRWQPDEVARPRVPPRHPLSTIHFPRNSSFG